MPEKIIRDPVHDVIAFQMERPLDALLFRLLNAAEFQRLRRIRQLGMTHLAYPGADHSRYSHSLGVMETARKILDQLRRSVRIDEESETICVTGALLHDLGHGPLSHVFERVSGIHHERLTQRVVTDPESEVHRILFQHEKTLPERIVAFMRCQPKRTFYCDILSSQLDADRFDYLLRDNLMTGAGYGHYDLQWLVHALMVHDSSDRLAVSFKGISAVEAYLQARYHMYRNVYFHKVVRSAEGMVKLALQRAKRLATQGRLEWPTKDQGVLKALTGQRMSMAEFRDLDDISVQQCFKLWSGSNDAILAGLCRGLMFRKVYKTIDLSDQHDVEKVARAVVKVGEAITSEKGDPAYEMFFDEPVDTPYETYDAADLGGKEIMVVERSGKLTPFAAISPMTQALNRQLMFKRLHFAPQWNDAVRGVLKSELNAGA